MLSGSPELILYQIHFYFLNQCTLKAFPFSGDAMFSYGNSIICTVSGCVINCSLLYQVKNVNNYVCIAGWYCIDVWLLFASQTGFTTVPGFLYM